MFTVEKSSNTDFGAMMITIELTWIVLLHCAGSGPQVLEGLSCFIFTAPWSRYSHSGPPFTHEDIKGSLPS